MDQILYNLETNSPYERAVSLTHKGQAIVHLWRLRQALAAMSEPDRTEIVAETREMLADLDQAA